MLNNTFLRPTLILMAVAIPVWFIIRMAFRRKIPGLTISSSRELLYFVFYMYLIALAAITIVPLAFALRHVPAEQDINMIPFKSIWNSIQHTRQTFRPKMLFENTLGNIVLFLPLGFLLPLIWKKINEFSGIFLAGFFSSAGIECIQYIERSFGVFRSVDIDDVILNTVGAVLGWILVSAYLSLSGTKKKQLQN